MIPASLPLLFFLATRPAAASPAAPVRGRSIEARTASVFAGACHYGAEATTSGREALIVWRFASGSHQGVDLGGVEVAAALAGEGNLAGEETARLSILYFSDRASPAQRRAAGDLLRTHLGAVLGGVQSERVLPLRAELDGERYEVVAGGAASSPASESALFEIRGRLLPDRACCQMPYQVWYRPFADLESPVVGCNATFRYADPALGRVFERHDENTAFVGDFAFPGTEASPAR